MMNDLKGDFQKDWNATGVYHAKGIFKAIPNWEQILNILNVAIRDKKPQVPVLSGNNFEILYKDLFAIKKLIYPDKGSDRYVVESDATFFFSLFFNKDTLGSVISESIKNEIENIDSILDIKSDYTSLKISLSDKFVPYEVHEWNTCIIHLAGTNDWKLRNNSIGFEQLYILEPGDLLLFKSNVEHELSNESPRSSIVGRMVLGESHE
jgi:hypothetical protein